METEHNNTTTVRLDLRKTGGWTTFGALKAFVEECEAYGATDTTPAVIVHASAALLGGFQPILGLTIDHLKRPQPLPPEPVASEEPS